MKLFIILVICGAVVGQHNQYYGNPHEIVFPGPVSTRNRGMYSRARTDQSDLAQEIALARQLSELNSVDEYLNLLDGVPDSVKDISLTSRIGGEERTSVIKPVPGNCTPELQSVPFETNNTDPSVTYGPTCARIRRCGGCCGHRTLTCKPVTTEIRNFEVIRVKSYGRTLKFDGKEIIPLEEHTSCSCQCVKQPKDCSEKHKYVLDECGCRCLNSDEEAKCKAQDQAKRWIEESCTCECSKVEVCATGLIFNHNTCSCQWVEETWEARNNYGSFDGSGNNPLAIFTYNAPNPKRKHKDEPKD